MIFWDSSALVSLLVTEPGSAAWQRLFEEDPSVAVWWATAVECESALQRLLREKALNSQGADQARELLAELSSTWLEVPPAAALRQLAIRLLRTHPLRAADACQLAAALTLVAAGIKEMRFASSDSRLNDAAAIENLSVVR